jgi:hypothetical protein
MGQIAKLTGEGGIGTVVESTYMLVGLSFPLTIEVVEDQVNPEWGRWKGKISGPLSGEQTWIHVPKNGETEVTAEVEYTVPGVALGRIADRLIIERMQEGVAEQTLQNLKLLCEAE